MSVASLLLCANWLAEWNWKEKWQYMKSCKQGLVLASLFLACCFGLIMTDNWDGGLHNLMTKLPLLLSPLFFITSKPLTKKEVRVVIYAFVGSTLFCCCYSTIYWLSHEVQDIRDISVFIDHIRFSLCIVLAIVFCLHDVLYASQNPRWLRILMTAVAMLLTVYLFIAQTLTGVVVFFAVLLAYLIYLCVTMPHSRLKTLTFSCLFILLLAGVAYFSWITYDYYHNRDRQITATHTAQGNPYVFDPYSVVENGHKIGYYICYPELQSAWAVRSKVPYSDPLESTLIRYLNSKGLHKDYAGVMSLTTADVHNVEQSIANYEYTKPFGLRRAFYPTFFTISLYRQYRCIEHASLLERVELWRASWGAVQNNWVLGVGIGDQKAAVDHQLMVQQSPIAYKHNRGCHNQFLTFWLMGGIFLVLYFIFVLVYPFFALKNKIGFVYIAFFIIIFLSMLVEDTLEVQTGRMLYAIFNPLLLFAFQENNKA